MILIKRRLSDLFTCQILDIKINYLLSNIGLCNGYSTMHAVVGVVLASYGHRKNILC